MKAFIFLICSLPYFSHSQKICYELSRDKSNDFPCDPGAAVSACCSPGATCATSLYCISPLGAQVVGTCTDKNFDDPACPWPLNKTSPSTIFDYKLNTTTCDNQSICPSDQPHCCSQGRGKVEIRFHNNAAIPSARSDLLSYYSAASYTTFHLATTSLTSSLSASTILTTSATTTRPTTSPAPSPKQSNKAVKPGVGAAIGIALALCLSLPVAIIVYSRRCSRGRNRNDPEIFSHKLSVYNERSATPDDEIVEAVRISRLNELPDSGRVIAAELDVRRQTQGGGFGPAELEGHDDTGGVGALKKI